MSHLLRIDFDWNDRLTVEKMSVLMPEWFGLDRKAQHQPEVFPVAPPLRKNVVEFVKILLRVRLEHSDDDRLIILKHRDVDKWDTLKKGGGQEIKRLFPSKTPAGDDIYFKEFMHFTGRGSNERVEVCLDVFSATDMKFRCRLPAYKGRLELVTTEQLQIMLEVLDHAFDDEADLHEFRERLSAEFDEGDDPGDEATEAQGADSPDSTAFRLDEEQPPLEYEETKSWQDAHVVWQEVVPSGLNHDDAKVYLIRGTLTKRFDDEASKAVFDRIRAIHRLTRQEHGERQQKLLNGLTSVVDAGIEKSTGHLFFTETKAEGQSLEKWVMERKQEPHYGFQCAGLVARMARSLHELHKRNLVHLHLEPSHIVVADDSTPVISGVAFGAVLSHVPYQIPHASFGLAFRSPEQVDDLYAGEASDIYSLGAILYWMLLQSRPFEADSPKDLMNQIRSASQPAASSLDIKIHPDVSGVCQRCLEKEPFARYDSLKKMASELERIAHSPRELNLRTQDSGSTNSVDESSESRTFQNDVYICGWGVDDEDFEAIMDALHDLELRVAPEYDDPNDVVAREECQKAARASRVIIVPCTTLTVDTEWVIEQSEWASGDSGTVVPIVLEDGIKLPQQLDQWNVLNFVGVDQEMRHDQLAKATKRRWWLPHANNADRFFESLRQDELRHVWESLKSTRVCLLHGPPGIGKSDLATYYAYQHEDEYEGNVLWITCTNDYVRNSNLAQIAQRAPEFRSLITSKQGDPARIIRRLISRRGFLIILDDVPNGQFLADLHLDQAKAHVLITSQESFKRSEDKLPERQLAETSRVPIDKFDLEQSLKFVAERLQRPYLHGESKLNSLEQRERKAAVSLLEEIDGLPLVLDKFAIRAAGSSLELLWNEYRKAPGKITAPAVARETGHTGTPSLYWLVRTYYDRVKEDDPGAADIIHICCFFHHEQIPNDLFVFAADEVDQHSNIDCDDIRLETVERRKKRLIPSLIQPDPDEFFNFTHRLVHSVLRDIMKDGEDEVRWGERAISVLNRAFPKPEYSKWKICEGYMRHVQVALTRSEELGLKTEALASLLCHFAEFIMSRYSRFEDADRYLHRATAIHAKSDPASPVRILAKIQLCECSLQREDAQTLMATAIEGRDLCHGVLQLLERTDAETAAADDQIRRYFVASVFSEDATGVEADSVSDRFVRAKFTVRYFSLGFEAKLARSYQMTYESEKATALTDDVTERHRTLIKEWETALPHDFKNGKRPDELLTDAAHAYDLSEKEDRKAVRELVRQALATSHETSDNPDSAESLGNMGILAAELEDWTVADASLTRATRMLMRLYNHHHDRVAEALRNVAYVRSYTDRHANAMQLVDRAIADYTSVFSRTHGSVASARLAKAWFIARNEELDAALREVESVLSLADKATWGPAMPDSLIRIAKYYAGNKRYQDALSLTKSAGKLYERAKRQESVEYVRCLHALALLNWQSAKRKSQDRAEDTQKMLEKVLESCDRLFEEKKGSSSKIRKLRSRITADIETFKRMISGKLSPDDLAESLGVRTPFS